MFEETIWYFAYTNICVKKFDAKMLMFDKMIALFVWLAMFVWSATQTYVAT